MHPYWLTAALILIADDVGTLAAPGYRSSLEFLTIAIGMCGEAAILAWAMGLTC